MKQTRRTEDLNKLMNKIYKTEEIAQERIDCIVLADEDNEDGVSYGQVCCDSRYSRATIIGCTLSVF